MAEKGRITSEKIAENEFLYQWEFSGEPNRRPFRSPIFGPLCSVLSNCYLQAEYYFSGNVIFFSLKDCDLDYEQHRLENISLETVEGGHFQRLPTTTKYQGGHFYVTEISKHPLPRRSSGEFDYYVYTLQINVHLPSPMPEPGMLLPDNQSSADSSAVLINEESERIDSQKGLIQDLKSFYAAESMCDLDIRIGEVLVRAHKFILCARSPVFRGMMEHDCVESASNCITIADCSAVPFKEFLRYLYTGEIEDRSMDTLIPLYSLADKYDVPSLRKACSGILQYKLSEFVDDITNTVCDILQLAQLYRDSKLKDSCVSFIVKHFQVVSNQQGWKDLMSSDFELTSEILALVLSACQKTKT